VIRTIGRLREGASTATATAELDPVLSQARDAIPDLLKGSTLSAVGLRQAQYGTRSNALLMLMVVALALGLIATAISRTSRSRTSPLDRAISLCAPHWAGQHEPSCCRR
jgi:hypothetical protein